MFLFIAFSILSLNERYFFGNKFMKDATLFSLSSFVLNIGFPNPGTFSPLSTSNLIYFSQLSILFINLFIRS